MNQFVYSYNIRCIFYSFFVYFVFNIAIKVYDLWTMDSSYIAQAATVHRLLTHLEGRSLSIVIHTYTLLACMIKQRIIYSNK